MGLHALRYIKREATVLCLGRSRLIKNMHSGWPWKLSEIHYNDGYSEKRLWQRQQRMEDQMCPRRADYSRYNYTLSRIREEANGLKAGSKTAKMKGLICQVQGVFIEYSRLSDTLEVI